MKLGISIESIPLPADEPTNQAVRFYAENGFERLGPRVEGRRVFVEFQKPLGAP